MANRVVHTGPQSLDPMFHIPVGMEDDWEYSDDGYVGSDADRDEFELTDDFIDGGDDEDEDDGPEVPEILGIVSQTVRHSDEGTKVIDVVIEVEDIPGITKYEIRVTKV